MEALDEMSHENYKINNLKQINTGNPKKRINIQVILPNITYTNALPMEKTFVLKNCYINSTRA